MFDVRLNKNEERCLLFAVCSSLKAIASCVPTFDKVIKFNTLQKHITHKSDFAGLLRLLWCFCAEFCTIIVHIFAP
ncbi:hypothetical protein CWE21_11195 [Pseudidiomarina aquimaris]|uniref:Uncharacterized protein n=1 Tax=Pseudidiomarina aquimaris TaxID=641841 RepID=A0A432XCE0_9GAMM|nr:hypothetical protein CWE21_11195 [Pseudidiomarina aquimaris]